MAHKSTRSSTRRNPSRSVPSSSASSLTSTDMDVDRKVYIPLCFCLMSFAVMVYVNWLNQTHSKTTLKIVSTLRRLSITDPQRSAKSFPYSYQHHSLIPIAYSVICKTITPDPHPHPHSTSNVQPHLTLRQQTTVQPSYTTVCVSDATKARLKVRDGLGTCAQYLQPPSPPTSRFYRTISASRPRARVLKVHRLIAHREWWCPGESLLPSNSASPANMPWTAARSAHVISDGETHAASG
jgi:hypothetical protein